MKSHKRRLITIGVTGGIGSGKTEVCRIFQELGVPVISADAVAKEIGNYDPRVKQLMVDLMGSGAYTAEGVLDRPYVASRVFSSKSVQKKVNAIIHPRVEEEIERRFHELDRNGVHVAIVEAALIFEAGFDRNLDAVVVVEAGETARIDRVMKRDGFTRQAVIDRMHAQMDPVDKLRKADYILHNDGTLEELEGRVRFLNSVFQKMTESIS